MRDCYRVIGPGKWLCAVWFGLMAATAAGAELPDHALRQRVGPELYDRVSGLSDSGLTPEQQRVLDTFVQHRDTFAAYDADNPASYEAAATALGELYGSGDQPSALADVRWLLQAGVIDPDLSERMAAVRNRMVYEICEAIARDMGVVHRMDFSPAKNLLNDIDQTFLSPEQLKQLGIDGQRLVQAFNERFSDRFNVNAEHLDVVSHPAEATIPDWRQRVEVHEFVGALRQGSGLLSGNEEAYFLEGAFRMQVERRSYESDLELYSIFAANPHVEDGPVARVAVTQGKIRDIKYRFIAPPEMRRSYAWGSSVGNWHFYHRHAAEEPGAAARYAAKYGLRSFAEGPGWLVLYDNRTSSDIAPETYEKMVDLTAREDLVRQVYDRHYAQTGLSVDEVWATIEKARDIRNMGDRFSREAAFGDQARAALPDDAPPQAVTAMIDELDQRFQANMSTIMIENIQQSLPARLADWFDPQVSAYRLGFTLRDIKNDPKAVRAAVDAARKRLRTAAMFEVMHGLRVLDPAQRERIINRAVEDLKQRRGGERFTFERTLRAVARLASMEATPRLLQTDAEAGRNGEGREMIGEEHGRRLRVRTVDMAELAQQQQTQVGSEINDTVAELRVALREESAATAADLEGETGLRMLMAMDSAAGYLSNQWDQSLREASDTIEQRAELLVSPARRAEAVAAFRHQLLGALGYEFRQDWKAIEGIDLNRDVTGRSAATAARSLVTWGNADSLLNIIKTYRETNGNAEKVREQILMEAAGRLPLVGESIQLHAILQGQAHPGMLGVMAAGFFYPAVGQVMLVYSMGSNVYFIITDIQLDADTSLHLQGVIPNDDGSQGPGEIYTGGLPGFLAPVHGAMLAHRRKLQQQATENPDQAEAVQLLLRDVYTTGVRGAHNYVYEYYNPMIEEKLAQDPQRWPRDQWARIKLSSDYAVIRSNEPEDLLMPENQPPMLRAMFRSWVNDYMQGAGAFADLPGHRAAHEHPFIREQYFNNSDANLAEYNQIVDQMTSLLTASYQNALIAHAAGDNYDQRMLFDWVSDSDFLLIYAYLYGADGDKVTAYSDTYRNDPTVPDVPRFLDVVQPGGTITEQREGFFSYFDNYLNERLARHDKYKDMTADQWLEVKLGSRYSDLRPIAAEEQAVAHPLLMAFFNRQVKLYRDRLQPLIDAGEFKRVERGANAQGEISVAYYDPPPLTGELQKRVVQQLIRDYRTGMIRATNMRQQQTDRQVLDAALPNALALRHAGRAVWGGDEGGTQRMATLANMLALHSGDPLVDDAQIAAALKPLIDQTSQAQVTIVGELPEKLEPDAPFELSCQVAATTDYIRPFRVEWSFAKQGGSAGEVAPLAPDEGSNLMLAKIAVAEGDQPIAPGAYVVRASVTDATGRTVGAAEKLFNIGEETDEPTMVGGDGAKAMMYVRLESKPVDHGEGAGFMRHASTIEYEWQTPNAENANYTAHNLPHIWVDWPQRPSEEGHRYYFVGRITGGYPPIDKELSLSFHASGGMFRVQREEDGRFIFPLPDFEAREHVGTYKITGRVLAISFEQLREHGQREWAKATPTAEKPISVELVYHSVAPVVSSSRVHLSRSGLVRGSVRFDHIERGYRIAKIDVAGTTCYQVMDTSVGFEVPGQSTIPASVTVSFMNFGEVTTVSTPFDDVADLPEMFVPDQRRIDGIQESIREKDDPKNRTRLTDLRDAYRRLAYAYVIDDVAVDVDAWQAAIDQTLVFDTQIAELIGNPQWEEYKANSDFRGRKFEDEYFSSIESGGKRARAAREFQLRYYARLAYDYANVAKIAAKSGRMDIADHYVSQAEAFAEHASEHEQEGRYAWGQVAGACGVLGDYTFKQTGSVDQARAWHQRREAARRNEAIASGREYQPNQYHIRIDEKFGNEPPEPQ